MRWDSSSHRAALCDFEGVCTWGPCEKGLPELLRLCYAVCRRVGLSLGVFTTATFYLQRWYVGGRGRGGEGEGGGGGGGGSSDTDSVFLSCLYLAVKAHDVVLNLAGFVDRVSLHLPGVTHSKCVAFELGLLEALQFNLVVHSPFQALEAFVSEIRDTRVEGCDAAVGEVAAYSVDLVSLVSQPPLLLCFPPQLLAAASVLLTLDRSVAALPAPAQRAEACAALRRAPLVARFGTGAQAEQVAYLLSALPYAACLRFAVAADGEVAQQARAQAVEEVEDEEGAVAETVRAQELLFPESVEGGVVACLTADDLRSLRTASKRHWNAYSRACYEAGEVRGKGTTAAVAAATAGGGGGGGGGGEEGSGLMGFHLGEPALLRRVTLHLAYTGRACVRGHTFSKNGLAAVRFMVSHNAQHSVDLVGCVPDKL